MTVYDATKPILGKNRWHWLTEGIKIYFITFCGKEIKLLFPTSHYIKTKIILAFWLVRTYDLLEDRRTIDVIITKFFSPCFKMAKSFENLDNILRDRAKDKGQKSLVEALNRFEK